jgi:hypothetical protein
VRRPGTSRDAERGRRQTHMTSKTKPHAATSRLKRMAVSIERLFGENNRTRQVSLSLAGILALLLLLGPAVPEELRAEAGSRLASLAQYLDTSLAGAWHSAFVAPGLDHRAGISGNHDGSGSQPIGASPILTGGDTHPSEGASESLIDFNGPGSFGGGSESNSRDRVLSDILQDGNLGGRGRFGALAGSSASGNGSAGSGSNGHQESAVMGGSAGGGAASASAARSSSSTHSSSARSRKSDGALRLPYVKPDVKPDAHQNRVTGAESGFVSVYDVADASWNQLGSKESLDALKPGASNGSGAGNSVDPTNGDLDGHTSQGDQGSVLDAPVFRDPPVFSDAPVFQTEENDGDRHLDTPNPPNHMPNYDPHTGDPGPFTQSPLTEPDSGPLSSVPEPGSLVLMSLGLIAVILWGKFRPAR